MRKLLHLALSLIPLAGWLVSPRLMWVALWVLLGASVAVEAARRWWPWVNRTLWRLLPTVFREWEGRRLLGSTWCVLGSLAALWLFGPEAGAAGILFMALGDPAAELAGRRWGTPGRHKTLAGSLGCLAACLGAAAVAAALTSLPLWALLAGAAVATAAERWSPPPDDNLWMPVTAGLVVFLVG